jgi:hypothetical protein
LITASRIVSTFSHVFADTGIISDPSHPRRFTISAVTFATSADGRSTLLITGIISRLFSSAMYTLLRVCASIHCVASTIKSAHSTDARLLETSY